MEKPFGGWIAINKSTGEWTVCEAPEFQDDHRDKFIKVASDNYSALKNKTEFKKCFDDVEETFRGKPTGNRTLGTVCSLSIQGTMLGRWIATLATTAIQRKES